MAKCLAIDLAVVPTIDRKRPVNQNSEDWYIQIHLGRTTANLSFQIG